MLQLCVVQLQLEELQILQAVGRLLRSGRVRQDGRMHEGAGIPGQPGIGVPRAVIEGK